MFLQPWILTESITTFVSLFLSVLSRFMILVAFLIVPFLIVRFDLSSTSAKENAFAPHSIVCLFKSIVASLSSLDINPPLMLNPKLAPRPASLSPLAASALMSLRRVTVNFLPELNAVPHASPKVGKVFSASPIVTFAAPALLMYFTAFL